MRIRVKGITAEIEILLPGEKEVLNYHTKKVIEILDKLATTIVQLEKEMSNLNK